MYTLGENTKKFKAGEPMVEDGNICHWCKKGLIQVSVNGEGYWCRYCGFGGTMSYALYDSE